MDNILIAIVLTFIVTTALWLFVFHSVVEKVVSSMLAFSKKAGADVKTAADAVVSDAKTAAEKIGHSLP